MVDNRKEFVEHQTNQRKKIQSQRDKTNSYKRCDFNVRLFIFAVYLFNLLDCPANYWKCHVSLLRILLKHIGEDGAYPVHR